MTLKTTIDRDTAHNLLKMMLLMRAFEEQCIAHYTAGLIRGFLHVYIGEEAIATGVCHHLTDDDVLFATYREHGHALARGLDPNRIMAEMFGKVDGVSHGRGGSMHLFDAQRHFIGGNAIVASALPMAVGYALGLKMQDKPGVVVCFFGEGAMAEGAFHEAMNLASLWQVPILFVCENNLYAMGTALERSQAQTNLCLRAQSYMMRASSVDGMDVLRVEDAVRTVLQDMRARSEPYFLECKTYRFRAHSMFDPDLYRDPAEVALWKTRDPIELFMQTLRAAHLLEDSDVQALRTDITQIIDQASRFAAESPFEDVASLETFVYSEPPSPVTASTPSLGSPEEREVAP